MIGKSFILACLFYASASGGMIEWRSTLFQTNLTSSGSPLTSDWTFELGYFATGFTPTVANTSAWADRWTTLDGATYTTEGNRFSGVWIDDGEVPDGSRGYIWGFNRGASNPEWILLSATSWNFPLPEDDPLSPSAGQRWSVATSNQVVLGAVNSGGIHLRTESVTGSPPLLCGEDWQRLVFSPAEQSDPAVSGWDADPDRDGNTNLVEFAFGLEPKMPDQVTTRLFLQNGFLEVEVQRAENVKALYFGRVSSDLETWAEDAASVTLLQASARVLRYRDLTPVTNARRRFAQVRVALAP